MNTRHHLMSWWKILCFNIKVRVILWRWSIKTLILSDLIPTSKLISMLQISTFITGHLHVLNNITCAMFLSYIWFAISKYDKYWGHVMEFAGVSKKELWNSRVQLKKEVEFWRYCTFVPPLLLLMTHHEKTQLNALP